MVKKNVAFTWIVFAFDLTDNTPVTGDGTGITGSIWRDGTGALTIVDSNPTELGGGYYGFDISGSEANFGHLLIVPQSSTANVQVIGVPGAIYTELYNGSDLYDIGLQNGTAISNAGTAVAGTTIADLVWDEALTGATHNVATSAGKRLRQLGDVTSDTVNGTTATTTTFPTNQTSVDDFYNDQLVRFTSGNLAGLVRVISDFANSGGVITVSEEMPEAPANGDAFDIIPFHVHPDHFIEANVELTSIPTTVSNLQNMIQFLFEYFRNKRTANASAEVLYKEDGSTPLGTASVSYNGTTFTSGEMN